MNEIPVRLEDLISHIDDQSPRGSTLNQLTYAAEVSRHLNDLADRLMSLYVSRARHGGASWAVIAREIGVSEQVAQHHYPVNTSDLFSGQLREDEVGNIFQAFTESASSVLTFAEQSQRDGPPTRRN